MTAPGTLAIYIGAALAEIAGCFAVWAWMRQGASPLWLLPGLVSLAVFAWLLTFAPADFAGRAYAAYGGVYIAASLVWLWLVEKQRPDAWDMTGAAICLQVVSRMWWKLASSGLRACNDGSSQAARSRDIGSSG